MATKVVNTRIQLKSDTEANWIHSALKKDGGDKETGTTFVPLKGELIIYSPDDNGSPPYFRLKVGDGVTSVPNLEFIDAGTINGYDYNGTNLLFYPQAHNFPRGGETGKLYIALDTKRIYYFMSGTGYTQLTHFSYKANTSTIKTIKTNTWNAGVMTAADVNDNKLTIENGSAPSLELEDVVVVTSIEENAAEIVVPQGDD